MARLAHEYSNSQVCDINNIANELATVRETLAYLKTVKQSRIEITADSFSEKYGAAKKALESLKITQHELIRRDLNVGDLEKELSEFGMKSIKV